MKYNQKTVDQAFIMVFGQIQETSKPFENPSVVKPMLQLKLMNRKAEHFAVLFLDNAHKLICYEELFHGTINGASVYPRIVVQKALELNAAAVIFAHNHPSGLSEASHADEVITGRLISILKVVDVRVLDHFIVGKEKITSMSELGLI